MIQSIKKSTFVISLILAVPFLVQSCKKGKVIETIGNHAVTTSEYEEYYSTYVEKASRFANAEKETLYKLMCNPDQVPPNPILQDMIVKLDPENNYEEYRQMRIIEQVAEKEGFTEKASVKAIIDQVVLETVVRLYLQEKLDERIKITQEQKQQKCEELRREYPGRIGPLPLDSCLYIAEGFIKQNIMAREEPKVREEIKESISVKKNPDVDKAKYLTKDLDLYQTMMKEGGCAPLEETPTQTPATK